MRVSDCYTDVSPINKQHGASRLTENVYERSVLSRTQRSQCHIPVTATVQFVALCAVRLHHVTSRRSRRHTLHWLVIHLSVKYVYNIYCTFNYALHEELKPSAIMQSVAVLCVSAISAAVHAKVVLFDRGKESYDIKGMFK
jgi:hypothetical protein